MVSSINAGIASPVTLLSEACSLAGHHTRLLLTIARESSRYLRMMIQLDQYCVRGGSEPSQCMRHHNRPSLASRGRCPGPAAQAAASKSSLARLAEPKAGTSLDWGSCQARLRWIQRSRPGANHVRLHAAWYGPHAQSVTTLRRHQGFPPSDALKMR